MSDSAKRLNTPDEPSRPLKVMYCKTNSRLDDKKKKNVFSKAHSLRKRMLVCQTIPEAGGVKWTVGASRCSVFQPGTRRDTRDPIH